MGSRPSRPRAASWRISPYSMPKKLERRLLICRRPQLNHRVPFRIALRLMRFFRRNRRPISLWRYFPDLWFLGRRDFTARSAAATNPLIRNYYLFVQQLSRLDPRLAVQAPGTKIRKGFAADASDRFWKVFSPFRVRNGQRSPSFPPRLSIVLGGPLSPEERRTPPLTGRFELLPVRLGPAREDKSVHPFALSSSAKSRVSERSRSSGAQPAMSPIRTLAISGSQRGMQAVTRLLLRGLWRSRGRMHSHRLPLRFLRPMRKPEVQGAALVDPSLSVDNKDRVSRDQTGSHSFPPLIYRSQTIQDKRMPEPQNLLTSGRKGSFDSVWKKGGSSSSNAGIPFRSSANQAINIPAVREASSSRRPAGAEEITERDLRELIDRLYKLLSLKIAVAKERRGQA